MSTMVDSVLQSCKPPEWELGSYSSKLYNLFDLNQHDNEFKIEAEPFRNGYPRMVVKNIQRIQNPLLLGRFKIKKEQKLFRHESVEELKYYHVIEKSDLKSALEFNLDVRRYTYKSYSSSDGKNPLFYKTPALAFSLGASAASDIVIIVCKVLGKMYEGTTITKTSDAEYLPEYVVEV